MKMEREKIEEDGKGKKAGQPLYNLRAMAFLRKADPLKGEKNRVENSQDAAVGGDAIVI